MAPRLKSGNLRSGMISPKPGTKPRIQDGGGGVIAALLETLMGLKGAELLNTSL